ncbi:MAG: ATP-dependent Clp protease proteolytic subunit [Planctomycetaceae bacterium]|nr:ATP-dependent Clp protease proteolytic subunit [Planctomycetaceae bacterium]
MEVEHRIDIISFMAPINDASISRLIDLTYTAHAEGSSQVHLYISSVGGKLHPAITAYHFFRSLRLPFFTHNIGSIETPAALLYLASDNRSASPNAKFFFYTFEWTFYRDHIRFPEITEAYESLKFDIESYVDIFNERTNRTFDMKCCLLGPPCIMGPNEALQAGILTDERIVAPEVPELAKLWSIH